MKRIYYIAVLIGLITLINGCKKSATVTEPSLTTSAVTGITFTAAANEVVYLELCITIPRGAIQYL